MPYDKGMGWKGANDGTPSADPKVGPADYPESKGPGDWHGLDTGTPSSKPKDPDKE